MGQYWKVVNLDKKEFINAHELGCGLKLWEQVANHPGTAAALIILCAAMPESRGGGDLDLDSNWHGADRVDMTGQGPIVEEYQAIAKRTIGRWAGCRIALIGDYAEQGDLPNDRADQIYEACGVAGEWVDVSMDVAKVLEHELRGHFSGDGGYRQWHDEPEPVVKSVHAAQKVA